MALEGKWVRKAKAISRNCCRSIWCWSCQGDCCWCCCRCRHWWSCPSRRYWLWPWKESGSWGQEAGADQDRLGAEEEGTVWQVCRRTRGGGNCGHGKIEGAVRGCRRRAWYCGGSDLAAETHDTWSRWACRCTGRRCCWCCTSCCCTSGCCRWCWTSGGRSLRQETWLQGWSSPCSKGKGCQAGPRQEAPSKSQARPRLQTSPS